MLKPSPVAIVFILLMPRIRGRWESGAPGGEGIEFGLGFHGFGAGLGFRVRSLGVGGFNLFGAEGCRHHGGKIVD